MIEKERLQIDPEESARKLNELNEMFPNTIEMDLIYRRYIEALSSIQPFDDCVIILVDAIGGSGKSTLAKKLWHYTRSKGELCQGYASTGLACRVYGTEMNFSTVHSGFTVPVILDEDDLDNNQEHLCDITKHPQKVELIKGSKAHLFDEMSSLHSRDFNAVYKSYNNLKGKVVVMLMDCGQTAPVVKKGRRKETVEASIIMSQFYDLAEKYTLTINMRLLGMQNTINQNDQFEIEHMERQRLYSNQLLCIRSNRNLNSEVWEVSHDEELGLKIIVFQYLDFTTDEKEAIDWLYPEGFQTEGFEHRRILAATNEQCAIWNKEIQALNPNQTLNLFASEMMEAVDDDFGNLAEAFSEPFIRNFHMNGIPDHELSLKKNDLVFLLRTISKYDGLCKNVCLKIVSLSNHRVRVVTLDENPKYFNIPRIRFRMQLPFGGFIMIRTQFPFELAYCMTKNKCQGQTLRYVLNDISSPSFSHGQEYVAMSRVNDIDNLKLFCNKNNIYNDSVTFTNIVYDELLVA
jgi:ATP-dependent DNA helicase PIF1